MALPDLPDWYIWPCLREKKPNPNKKNIQTNTKPQKQSRGKILQLSGRHNTDLLHVVMPLISFSFMCGAIIYNAGFCLHVSNYSVYSQELFCDA